jgi:hypothetical protein
MKRSSLQKLGSSQGKWTNALAYYAKAMMTKPKKKFQDIDGVTEKAIFCWIQKNCFTPQQKNKKIKRKKVP